MMQLSQSEIAAWTRCPRMWFIEYYLGFQPADEKPYGNKQLGIRIHTALEGHYGYQLNPATVLHVLYQVEIANSPEFEIELKQEMALGMIMVNGYLEWVEAESKDRNLQLVATEAALSIPLPDMQDVILRGRLDQVVLDHTSGALKFLDHKSADSFTRHETLELDPQFRIYSLLQFLAAGHGEPVPGMQLRSDRPVVMGGIVNTLRRVKRSAQSKPPYYDRDEVRHNVEVLSSTMAKVRQTAREIQGVRAELDRVYAAGGRLQEVNWAQRHILRPVQIPTDCSWRCPASKGLCVAMDDGSDWAGILTRSGRFIQADPYARYAEDPLRSIREKIASP